MSVEAAGVDGDAMFITRQDVSQEVERLILLPSTSQAWFMQSWGLNCQLCACAAVTLPTRAHPQPEVRSELGFLFEHPDILCSVLFVRLFVWLLGCWFLLVFKTRFLSISLISRTRHTDQVGLKLTDWLLLPPKLWD